MRTGRLRVASSPSTQTPKRSNDSRRPDCTPGVYELDRREFPASFSRRIRLHLAPRCYPELERGLYFNNWANRLSRQSNFPAPSAYQSLRLFRLHRGTGADIQRGIIARIDSFDRLVGRRLRRCHVASGIDRRNADKCCRAKVSPVNGDKFPANAVVLSERARDGEGAALKTETSLRNFKR